MNVSDRWFIENGTVVTLGKTPRVIERGAVLTEGGKIAAVGTAAALRRRAGRARRLDASGKVVMPGFICAHHHLYSTFARGLTLPAFRPKNFIEILKGLWWKLDRALDLDDVYWSALPPLIEGLKAGVTTVIDHHESQSAQDGSLDALERAVTETGVRACLTLGVSDRYGRGREGLRENERFLKKLEARRGPSIVTGMVGLHASFTVRDETLDACAELAARHRVGIHTHCAEDSSDEEHARRTFGMSVVERFYKHRVLAPNSLLVHCVHVNDRELDLLREMEVAVVHNPESNMNNAVGAADVLKFTREGVLVGLGTDGMSSQMPLQARAAYLLQRHVHRDPRAAFGEALQMLLANNAEIANRLGGLTAGELAPGAAADVIVADYRPPTPMTAANFGGHLLFGVAFAPVDDVFVAGRLRLRHRRLVDLDEEALLRKARERAARFWRKVSK